MNFTISISNYTRPNVYTCLFVNSSVTCLDVNDIFIKKNSNDKHKKKNN